MSPIFFWLFSAIMLGFGCLVVINRNPIASALSLVVSFMALAVLFAMLDAFFIGVIEVLVYAGAIMVLFLFIIMLLDLKAEERRTLNMPATIGGLAVAVFFVRELYSVLSHFPSGHEPFPPLAPGNFDDVHSVGAMLFSGYNLPFQIIGALILVATVGVVVLSKRELK
jgi:NADH-quinone oxidoreductase subunit J